ncbi:Alkaline phosphatase synthesis sensor protein PhoR [Thiorhodovibrio winogradskyi]|uniref:histidine kinase n=1 Tax=Thiorhodovibrio winogradskyi TaxID=77007 RepID=A0ABZ0SA93_9GAMM|nr:ATP-binding protein [Thiorhodovibrio winogradskyi]
MKSLRIRLKTKLLIVLLLTALLPLASIGWFGYRSTLNISQIADRANQDIAELAVSDSSAALSAELETRLAALTARYAEDINEILGQVQADTLQLAAFAAYLYQHPDSLKRYAQPSTYSPAPQSKMFGAREPNQNSWLGVFGDAVDKEGRISKDTLAEVYLTEYMDIMFRAVAETNPYAVQIYINTAGQISRGMPFVDGAFKWVDATEQFANLPDVTAYDFYYLADSEHNPERGPAWTELYWDPAGLGWMVSSIAPVYRGDEHVAVIGIDITLERIVDGILNLQIEQTGFAFLLSEAGQAIAFPERAADFLQFRGSFQGQFKKNEAFAHSLTAVRDRPFQDIIAAMQRGERALTRYRDPASNETYLIAYHDIAVTGWSVGIVVPEAEIIAPALATERKIQASQALTAERLQARSDQLQRIFIWLLLGAVPVLALVAFLFARTISRPIQALDQGSRRVGAGELGHRIQVHSGDEIEALALTFNRMAEDLQTKLREIEDANRELRQLDQLKSKFISMASHELRTPLIAIQGYVDLIREGKGGPIAAEQRRMLDTVSRNATRLARIVAELLDVSRIEENKLVIEQAPVDLAPVIREIAEEQQSYLDSRGHQLQLELAPKLPLVTGDRDRLAQVVINLLGNAIKYTPDGGRILIRLHRADQELRLEVIDSGIGIKQEDIGKLFQRFSTLGDVTKHHTGKNAYLASGTGLGLSIVQGILQAHCGRIWVESEYGQGSNFQVALPIPAEPLSATPALEVASPEPQQSETKPPGGTSATRDAAFKVIQFEQSATSRLAPNQGERLTLLVVDDEPDVIEFTRDLLGENYNLLSAQTSATALREAIGKKPDLILLDAWIPGISGYDICRTLKNNSHTSATPIIIFTAATQKIDEERARAAGADGFVTKPFRRQQMIELIESFRENH